VKIETVVCSKLSYLQLKYGILTLTFIVDKSLQSYSLETHNDRIISRKQIMMKSGIDKKV
jgi:hypothetical protein